MRVNRRVTSLSNRREHVSIAFVVLQAEDFKPSVNLRLGSAKKPGGVFTNHLKSNLKSLSGNHPAVHFQRFSTEHGYDPARQMDEINRVSS